MIELSTALPAISVGPVKSATTNVVDIGGFALTLDALLPQLATPSTLPKGKGGEGAILLPVRQEAAEAGKELPDVVLGIDGKTGEPPEEGAEQDAADRGDEETPASPFAWFATAPLPLAEPVPIKTEAAGVTPGRGSVAMEQPAPQAPAAGDASALDAARLPEPNASVPAYSVPSRLAEPQRSIIPPVLVPALLPAQAGAEVIATPLAVKASGPVGAQLPGAVPVTEAPAIARSDQAAPALPPEPALDVLAAQAAANASGSELAPARTAFQAPLAQPPRELRQAAAEAPVVRIALAPVEPPPEPTVAAAPTLQQAVAAIDLPPAPSAATPTDPQAPDLSTIAAVANGTQSAAAVAGPSQSQGAPLDTRHPQWPTQMIERIEALRDAAPMRETRLSLMPEGLGKVDISIRHDDAGMHVAFNTDTQQARQLIADAQPKLAEIAEQRGVRIVSTSVESNPAGTGSGNNGGAANPQMHQGQRHGAEPNRQPSAPARARREDETSPSNDERVA